MWIDTFRLEVLGAFSGAKHYLDEMVAAIPAGGEQALLRVRREAEQGGWPWEEFDLAQQEVEGVFLYHLPRVMMRSFVIYLHSLAEHHLNSIARSVRTRGQLVLDIAEIHGRPIERARIYLTKVAGLDVSTLGEWKELRDLATVRNILVHNGGEIGRDQKVRAKLRGLAGRVHGLSATDGWDTSHSELAFGHEFCVWASASAYRFFHRLLDLAGHTGAPTELPTWARRRSGS